MKQLILRVNNQNKIIKLKNKIEIILIGIGILIIIILISGCIEEPEKPIINESINKVTITTDKTEYEKGETVKITVRNDLNKSIWDFASCGGMPFWGLQKFDDDTWRELHFSLPDLLGKETCDFIVCEKPENVELKQNAQITYDWHLTTICEWPLQPIGLPETESKSIEEGTYRVFLIYGLNKDYSFPEYKTIYSKEFTIKEKERQITKEQAIAIANATDEVQEFLKLYPNSEVYVFKDMLSGCTGGINAILSADKVFYNNSYNLNLPWICGRMPLPEESDNVWIVDFEYSKITCRVIINKTSGEILAKYPKIEYIRNAEYCEEEGDCFACGQGITVIGTYPTPPFDCSNPHCENFIHIGKYRKIDRDFCGVKTSCNCINNTCTAMEKIVDCNENYECLYNVISRGDPVKVTITEEIKSLSIIETSEIKIEPENDQYIVTMKILDLRKIEAVKGSRSIIEGVSKICPQIINNLEKIKSKEATCVVDLPEEAKELAINGLTEDSIEKYNCSGELIDEINRICVTPDFPQFPPGVRKPAVYLYPREKSKINVSLSIDGFITKSEPEYILGWSVTAEPNGLINGKYDYLFYEAQLNSLELPDEGWAVEYSNLENWFDVNLKKLGLNEKELSQFKEYWLSELPESNFYEIRLLEDWFLKENMNLIINPKPDTIIRLNFYFKPLNEKTALIEPKIETRTRNGFTVVEWGGLLDFINSDK